MKRLSILYVSYDGISDSLGRSQILPYIRRLTRKPRYMAILSFEKDAEKNRQKLKDLGDELKSFGIKWLMARFHRGGFFAKIWDIICGVCISIEAVIRYKIKAVHARSYVPGFIALVAKCLFRVTFIFDMRGFWVDEKVDGRSLRKGSLKYGLAKLAEGALLLSADEIIVLTEAARTRMIKSFFFRKDPEVISVIPTCVDLELFCRKDDLKRKDFLGDRFVVSYFGNLGTFYDFNAMVDFFSKLTGRFKGAYFLIMTNAPSDTAKILLLNKGISPKRYFFSSAEHSEVPEWIGHSDVSMIFYNRRYSKEGCCPTKFAESLSCGVPVVINSGIGDCDRIVRENRVGVIIEDFTETSYIKGIEELCGILEDRDALKSRCRSVAENFFSLESGVSKYSEIYNRIA